MLEENSDISAAFEAAEMNVTTDAESREAARRRILGRYGSDAQALVDCAQEGEMEPIPGTPILWAELRWGARAEGVIHLDDLLLRRVRLGLVAPKGAFEHLPGGTSKADTSEPGIDLL